MPRRKNQERYLQKCEHLRGARSATLHSKKKKHEEENQQAEQRVDEESSVSVSQSDKSFTRNASKSKIEAMKPTASEHTIASDRQMWFFAHCQQLTELISEVYCPACHQGELSISVSDNDHAGFAAKLMLSCNSCPYQKSAYSSPRIDNSDKENVAFEINPRMVLFSHEIGKSHTALETLSTVMGMHNMHLTTYQGHDKRLSGMNTVFIFFILWFSYCIPTMSVSVQ